MFELSYRSFYYGSDGEVSGVIRLHRAGHDWRRIVHFNVTEYPTAQWTAQQIVEAFPIDTAPSYLIRDGDGIFDERVTRRIESLGIDEVITAPASPWQNSVAESFFGSLKQERVHWRNYQTRLEAQQDIFNYITMFYNSQRLHSYLDYMSPNQYEAEMVELKKAA